jgi:hypothetical protein
MRAYQRVSSSPAAAGGLPVPPALARMPPAVCATAAPPGFDVAAGHMSACQARAALLQPAGRPPGRPTRPRAVARPLVSMIPVVSAQIDGAIDRDH